jgi:hypothetical protein
LRPVEAGGELGCRDDLGQPVSQVVRVRLQRFAEPEVNRAHSVSVIDKRVVFAVPLAETS